jgi:hypothetical protein
MTTRPRARLPIVTVAAALLAVTLGVTLARVLRRRRIG